MALMRPFSLVRDDLNRLFYEMDRDFFSPLSLPMLERGGEDLINFWSPAVDVIDEDNEVIVKACIPGMKPDEMEVDVENNMLVIRGETTRKDEEKKKNYHRREIMQGRFYRQVPLPADVDGDKAKATFEHGVLTVSVPKSTQTKKHRVKIGS